MKGWIKVHRALFDNPVVTQSPEHLTVWMYLLTHATPRPYKAIFGGKEITVKRGQLITSRKTIAESVNRGVDGSKVHRILKSFENAHQIEQQTTNKNRLITLKNWNKYQSGEQQNEHQVNNKRTSNEQRANTNRELYKKIKNKEKIKNKKRQSVYSVETANFDVAKLENSSLFDEKGVD